MYLVHLACMKGGSIGEDNWIHSLVPDSHKFCGGMHVTKKGGCNYEEAKQGGEVHRKLSILAIYRLYF